MLFPLLLVLSAAPDNADFKKGEELFGQYKYADAAKAMTKARAAKGLDRAMLLRILEVLGVCAGQQRQSAAAQAAFKDLLYLAPGFQFETELAPRVMTPFFEARGQVVEGGGGLEVLAGKSMVTVTDRLKLGKAVRFHFKTPGAADWAVAESAITEGRATLPGAMPEVTWWAELIGDNGAQLALVGSEAAPQVEKPAPVAALTPAAPPTPPPEVTAPPPAKSGSVLRPVSYVLLAAGAVAGGVGGFFGYQSGAAFSQLRAGGLTKSTLTEKQADALVAQGRTNALIADGLYAGAGALGVTAVILWIAGAPSARVSIAPTPNGVVFAGSLP